MNAASSEPNNFDRANPRKGVDWIKLQPERLCAGSLICSGLNGLRTSLAICTVVNHGWV